MAITNYTGGTSAPKQNGRASTDNTVASWMDSVGSPIPKPIAPTALGPAGTNAVAFEKIYPESQLLSRPVAIAHAVLEDAIKRVESALNAVNEGDELVGDDELHHVVADLRELFCSREIGEGFASVVNAALSGLENLNGDPASNRQLSSLLRRLRRIQIEPFLSTAVAFKEIDDLEAAGFNVEPPGMKVLEDWLG
jgi:hypothetical protein